VKRCEWVPLDNPAYLAYHDEEWGVPAHGDGRLYEMLVLEGAQAGLSWSTILNKREGYPARSPASIPGRWRGSTRGVWKGC
jgi:DNA-3-methyladenine glycosylase I